MVYKVSLTDKAKSDLDGIIRYIAEELLNSEAAANLLADFVKQKNNLKDSPYMYPVCNDLNLQQKGYHRFLFYKKYGALYSINDTEKVINILHVFYAKRDYAKLV